MRPSAIFPQKARSRSLRTGGRPGERITARPVNAAAHPGGRPIENTSIVEVLRPPVERGQYTAVAFTEHLAAEGILASIGSVGDSFDNALAESVNSSYKTELIDHQPLYPGAAELSLATAEWVAFYNRQQPNGYCQDLTPDRAEALYYHRQRHPHTEEALK